MIDYLEIVDIIKDVKGNVLDDFNSCVSMPLFLSNLNSTIKQHDDEIKIERNEFSFTLNSEIRKSYSEVLFILKKFDSILYNKIDYKYIDFFEKFKDLNYNLEQEKFEKREFKFLTLEILSVLNLKFWCVDDDDRKCFLNNFVIKAPKEEKEIEDEEEKIQIEENENLSMMKNNWWSNLLNKIRKIKDGLRKD